MIHTPRIEKAIQKAAVLHHGQKRKSEIDLPYVSHLFSVAAILSLYTKDEDTIVAGLLHDTIEDTEYTEGELSEEFGERVRNIVMGVTEEKTKNGEKIVWEERKLGYIENLKITSKESLMVSAADKIHNLQSILNEHNQIGESFWEVFKPGPEKQLWYHGEVLKVMKEHLDNPIVEKFEQVYGEAKKVFGR